MVGGIVFTARATIDRHKTRGVSYLCRLSDSRKDVASKKTNTNSVAPNVHKDIIAVEARWKLIIPLVWRNWVR